MDFEFCQIPKQTYLKGVWMTTSNYLSYTIGYSQTHERWERSEDGFDGNGESLVQKKHFKSVWSEGICTISIQFGHNRGEQSVVRYESVGNTPYKSYISWKQSETEPRESCLERYIIFSCKPAFPPYLLQTSLALLSRVIRAFLYLFYLSWSRRWWVWLCCVAVGGCNGLLIVGGGGWGGERAGDGDNRFCETVYMGQTFGDMGQGIWHFRWTKECFSNYYFS